nr:hypothetical protein [Kibdelosporangium sp. MJ126-NF4]CTQ97549.1 hypothetical protein [Kibdelosporangium sp. MJ126-NF4]
MPVAASGPLNTLMPSKTRYVTNDKPSTDRAMSAQDLAPQDEGERKALRDAGFRGAWTRVFESGSDSIARYRRETYSLYEFATADGACDYQQYVDDLRQANPVTVHGVPEASEVSTGPSAGTEATTTIAATKGRFRVVATAEARDGSLARYGAMDIFELFCARVT